MTNTCHMKIRTCDHGDFICKTDWTAFVAVLLIAVHLSFKNACTNTNS